MAKKSSNYVACKDGKMKSRCPCLGHGQGCSSSCECVGCQNVHCTRSASSTIPSGVKRKRSPGIYKRKKGCRYLSSARTLQAQGPWTNYESVLLSSVMKLISLTDVLLFIFDNNNDNNNNNNNNNNSNKREEKTQYLSPTDSKFCFLKISKLLQYILLINYGKHG